MAYLDDKKVFLAGATGLAGYASMKLILYKHPSARIQASVHRTEPFFKDDRVEYVSGDLRDREDCRRMVNGCDCAIMAAASGGGAAVLNADPGIQVNNNALMIELLLEACCLENVKRIVVANSATLYQEFEGHIREDELDLNVDPHSAYFGVGWVTRFGEKLCEFWSRESGLEVVIARTSNIFGPYGSFDPARSNFIPAVIRKAVDKMDPFEVWGSPDVVRDVLYVDDFAEAIVAMMNRDDIKYDVFNIGSGVKTTVSDVVTWALKFAGHVPSSIDYQQDKPTTIKSRTLDCSKARDVLGWEPQYSIEQGVEKTVSWWIENRDKWTK